jgi:hypothetical protein
MRTDLRGFKTKPGFGVKSDFIPPFPRQSRSIALDYFAKRQTAAFHHRNDELTVH